jgi:hypothetical protein
MAAEKTAAAAKAAATRATAATTAAADRTPARPKSGHTKSKAKAAAKSATAKATSGRKPPSAASTKRICADTIAFYHKWNHQVSWRPHAATTTTAAGTTPTTTTTNCHKQSCVQTAHGLAVRDWQRYTTSPREVTTLIQKTGLNAADGVTAIEGSDPEMKFAKDDGLANKLHAALNATKTALENCAHFKAVFACDADVVDIGDQGATTPPQPQKT